MQTNNANFSFLLNPSVCCPSSCGAHCNECNGNEALMPNTCSAFRDNMCYQGDGGRTQCCASSIRSYKLCHLGFNAANKPKIYAPCRLSILFKCNLH